MHWLPPDSALKAAERAVHDPKCSGYGIDDGVLELRTVLQEKVCLYSLIHLLHPSPSGLQTTGLMLLLPSSPVSAFLCLRLLFSPFLSLCPYWQIRKENGLLNSSIMVTAGANQVSLACSGAIHLS